MPPKTTLIGSTGLVGHHFLESISEGNSQKVTAIIRQKISSLEKKNFIKQGIDEIGLENRCCSLFHRDNNQKSSRTRLVHNIDHDLPLAIAKIAKEEGCRTMTLISSV